MTSRKPGLCSILTGWSQAARRILRTLSFNPVAIAADHGRSAGRVSRHDTPHVDEAGRRALRVLIIGGDADGNLGDRAILLGLCVQARAITDHIDIAFSSANSEWWQGRLQATVLRPGLAGALAVCRTAARSDLVLCGGGGLFQDDDSLVKVPYWFLKIALMRALCPRVVGFSLGVGPLDSPISRVFARLAFGCMTSVSVRDPKALSVAQPLSRTPVGLTPDPALLLPAAKPEEARRALRSQAVPLDPDRPLVGVALRRWFPPRKRVIPHKLASWLGYAPEESSPEMERLVLQLAQVLNRLHREHGAHLLFLPSYDQPHEGDAQICQRIMALLDPHSSSILRLSDPSLYKAVTGELSVLLGGRMHPTIFAATMGTPTVALSYNQKFHGFFSMIGREDYVLDVERFVGERRVGCLSQLLDRALSEGRMRVDRIEALAGEGGRRLEQILNAQATGWAEAAVPSTGSERRKPAEKHGQRLAQDPFGPAGCDPQQED
jgi:polysaccharide pyruvyl transferase WcaK-like protein